MPEAECLIVAAKDLVDGEWFLLKGVMLTSPLAKVYDEKVIWRRGDNAVLAIRSMYADTTGNYLGEQAMGLTYISDAAKQLLEGRLENESAQRKST